MMGFQNQQQFQPQQFQQQQFQQTGAQNFIEWPTDRFLTQTNLQFLTPGMMPHINVNPIFPELNKIVARIASDIAQEIATTAAQNTARTFTFNQLSSNGWSNNDFFQIVQLVLDNLAMVINQRSGSNSPMFNPQEIDGYIKQAVAIKTAFNIAQSQTIGYTLPQNVIIEANNYLNSVKPMLEQINYFKQSVAQNNYRQPGQFNQSIPNQQFQPQQFQQVNNFQPAFQQQNTGFVPQQFNNSRFNNNTQQNAPLSPISQNVSNRDYFVPEFRPIVFNNGVPEQQQPQQQFQQNQFQQPTNNTNQPILQEWSSTPTLNTEPDLAVQTPIFRAPEIHNGFPEDNTDSNTLMNPVLEYVKPGFDVRVIGTDSDEKLVWKPSDLQPFPVAWDCLSEKIVLKKVAYQGKVFVVQQIANLTEEEMDQMRHAVGPQTLRDKAVVRSHNEEFLRNESLEEGQVVRTGPKVEYMSDCVQVTETFFPNTQDEVEAVLNIGTGTQVDKRPPNKMFPSALKRAGITKPALENKDEEGNVKWSDVGFLADAIFSTKVAHLKNINSTMRTYRERFIVPKIFVSSKPLDALFNEWTEQKSYSFLAEKLRKTLNGEKLATTEAVEFAASLDAYLTSGINDFLSQNLHLTTKIESFCEDIDTITINGYIKEHYGEFMHECIMDFEKEFFNKFLTKIDDEVMIENINERILDGDDSISNVHYLAFECAYTITSVRAHSSEFKLFNNSGYDSGNQKTMISSKNSDLFEFCKIHFEEEDIKKYTWMKHLVVTSDSKVYVIDSCDHGTVMYAIQELAPIWLMP